MEIKVSFRKAVPADLKQDKQTLKIGQTYAILREDGQSIEGIFSIHGNEDPFILKQYLDKDQILIPENDPSFSDWIKETTAIADRG